jgi:hypothetical protein
MQPGGTLIAKHPALVGRAHRSPAELQNLRRRHKK